MILSLDDNNIKMIYSRGNANMRMGRYQEALTDFNVALTLSPSEPEMDMLNRNIVICTKHLPVSIDVSNDLKMYETIKEDDSPTPTNDMIECMTAMKEGRYDDAIRLASDIISSTPTSRQLLLPSGTISVDWLIKRWAITRMLLTIIIMQSLSIQQIILRKY